MAEQVTSKNIYLGSHHSLVEYTEAAGMSNASTVLCFSLDGPHPQSFSRLRAGEGCAVFGETRATSSPHQWRGGRDLPAGRQG